MFRSFFVAIMLLVAATSVAQSAITYTPDINSPSVVLNDDWEAPAVMLLGSDDILNFSFDEMSHTYKRYICKVTHHNADYLESELAEIDYLEGFNGFPIENWENSVNTTCLYTHYQFTIPNENISLKVSGNYRVEVFDDESPEEAVASFDFSVVEPLVGVRAWVSGDTDRSLNSNEQQLSFVVDYSEFAVGSPASEIIPVVMQNRRRESAVASISPTYVTGNELQYVHNEKLIFPAGNEFRRFELTDLHVPGMGVEEIIYESPFYHALLYIDKPRFSHSNYRDENGKYFINTLEGRGSLAEADYAYVHFALDVPQRAGGNYYLMGDFCGILSPDDAMEYDSEGGYYFISRLLKLGLYNYRYVWVADGSAIPSGVEAEGDFYDTENEYLIYIYYRAFGSRYDRLVGVGCSNYTLEDN